MRATPPARALSWFVDFLDKYWGAVILVVIVVLVSVVFAPRGMIEAMVVSGVVGAGVAVVWIGGSSL